MGELPSVRGTVDFVRTVTTVTRDENVTFMAGSLAYHAFVSLVPLAALLFLGLAVVGSEPLAERVLTLVGSLLSPEVGALLQRHVDGGALSGSVGASIVGVVTLLWGSLKLFRGLDTAFSEIYATTVDASFVDGVADGIVVIVTVPVALLVVVLTTTVLSIVTVTTIHVASPVLLVLALVVVFLPLYYVFPDTDVSVREVLPGAAVAALGWMVLQQLFQVYVGLAGTSAGGVVGAVILSLTWLYFAGVVLLVGCAVNAVHGGYHGTHT